jgi:hypothetical protein
MRSADAEHWNTRLRDHPVSRAAEMRRDSHHGARAPDAHDDQIGFVAVGTVQDRFGWVSKRNDQLPLTPGSSFGGHHLPQLVTEECLVLLSNLLVVMHRGRHVKENHAGLKLLRE